MLQLTINGQARQIAPGATLAILLQELALTGKRVAIELNGEIVPRGLHAQTGLTDGDRLEIVIAVGGG